MKSPNWSSTIGTNPSSARPIAAPMAPDSMIGVLRTRDRPNFSTMPAVTLKAPPYSAMSWPRSTTPGRAPWRRSGRRRLRRCSGRAGFPAIAAAASLAGPPSAAGPSGLCPARAGPCREAPASERPSPRAGPRTRPPALAAPSSPAPGRERLVHHAVDQRLELGSDAVACRRFQRAICEQPLLEAQDRDPSSPIPRTGAEARRRRPTLPRARACGTSRTRQASAPRPRVPARRRASRPR